MSLRPSPTLLLRQFAANRGYVLRRAASEATSAALLRLAAAAPGLAKAARRLQPNDPEPHRVLAARAQNAGHHEEAEYHRGEALRLDRYGSEPAVLSMLLGRRQASTEAPAAERLGSRLDAARARARDDLARGECEAALTTLGEALAEDPGREDLWRELGRAALAAGDPVRARHALQTAVSLDPTSAQGHALLGEALGTDPAARAALGEALARAFAEETFTRLDALERAPGDALPDSIEIEFEPRSIALAVGGSATLRVRLRASGADAAVTVLEPFGAGLAAEPHGRVEVPAGGAEIAIRVEAHRPDLANLGQPWELRLAGVSQRGVETAVCKIRVLTDEPGAIHYIITEDHELYDERERLDCHVARTTLVDKSELGERIANAEGARWTHMVDVASVDLLGWAGKRGDATDATSDWAHAARDLEEHLVSAVEKGNDLGLHCHAFHSPDFGLFVHGFDEDTNEITTDSDFLDTPSSQRGFWSRAFPALGEPDAPGTRAWATWQAVGKLEARGRLGDPRYRCAIFRAGSFDFGEDAAERGRSLELLARMGFLADSNVAKPRLYHRVPARPNYFVRDDIREPVQALGEARIVEFCPEFNIESDFLSDAPVMNRYVDRRVRSLKRPDGETGPGVHVICSMSHDKFINWRMGRKWDSLDPDYGDWATIRDHLHHVAQAHPEVRFSTAREAALAWTDFHTPQLLAWRDEEIVEASAPGASAQIFRYAVRLLGQGIEASPQRPRRVDVHLPAWLEGRIREARIERDGNPQPAERHWAGPPRLAFDVDSREASWQLVVVAEPGDGIELVEAGADGALRLSSRHHYRRASVRVPAALAGLPEDALHRGIRFEPAGDLFEARISG